MEEPNTTICLNMIVKNEAHIIHEVLEAVSPYIDYWVIVDTGSEDGTEDCIRAKMAELGIPGELHNRAWLDFGHNRSEALTLAQGKADYIWVMDADDTIVGTPDFRGLTADGYEVRVELEVGGSTCWRFHLFKNGAPWRYTGKLHEFAVFDQPNMTRGRIEGDFRIVGRERGGRNVDRIDKLKRDRDTLLAQVQLHPFDSRSIYYLAQAYESLGDNAEARHWYQRRVEMTDAPEEGAYALYRLAIVMDNLGEPWAEIQDTFLKAWAAWPTRAEPLYKIASHYRSAEQYELGYVFAAAAASLPEPKNVWMFLESDIYAWRAHDEKAVCGSWTGRQAEALKIWRQLLTRNDIPGEDRERIRINRDAQASQLFESCASSYPAACTYRPPGRADAEVTVSLAAGPDAGTAARTLNSFLQTCTDFSRVGRLIAADTGLSTADRDELLDHFPFLEFIPVSDESDLGSLRPQIGGRYWLHLWHGWRFFTEEALITRLIAVLDAEPAVFQAGINLYDAQGLDARSPTRDNVLTTPCGHRYVLAEATSRGPAMFEMTRLNRVLGLAEGQNPLHEATATLDEVLCVQAG